MTKRYSYMFHQQSCFTRFLLLMAILCMAIPSFAQDFEIEGVKYAVTETDECEVTGTTIWSGDLLIPSTVTFDDHTYRVTGIKNNAFRNTSLNSIELPNSIETIGDAAFEWSIIKGELKLPESLRTIGAEAFSRSQFTGSLTIPNNVEIIGELAFSRTMFTGSLIIGDGVRIIGKQAFIECRFTGSLSIPDAVEIIDEDAFAGCTGFDGDLTIGDGVTIIGQRAFSGCNGFTGSLYIGNSVEVIDERAFDSCKNLTGSLSIPNSVKTIGRASFMNCSGFSGSLILGDAVSNIGTMAFGSCGGLDDTLVLPATLNELGSFPFDETNFTTIVTLNPTPPENSESGVIFYSSTKEKVKLYVPNGCMDVYANNSQWSDFKEIVELAAIYTGLSLSSEKIELTVGEDFTINYSVLPDYVPTPMLTWKSSDESVATVDDSGVVTAVKEGMATITAATPNNLTATCEVTVKPLVVEAEGVTLDKTTLNLTEGETATLLATVSPENTTDKTVTWTSSDATVASVNTGGVVTAIKAGTSTITVSTTSGLTATCDVTVKATTGEASGLTLNLEETELVNGKTVQLQATVIPGNATDKSVTWTSSDATVATVNASGLVTAIKLGTAIITASTANGLKATCEVTVVAATVDALGLELNLEEAEIVEGESVQLQATVLPADATDKTVTWTSSDAAVATVNASGLVTALKPGKATITASTANGLKAICEVTVVVATVGVSGLELNLEEAEIVEGESVQLQATVLPADATDKIVTWTSSDETVATVNASGMVSALKTGTATITAATANGLTATCTVTVTAKPSGIEGVDGDGVPAVSIEGGEIVISGDGVAEIYSLTGSRVAVANGGRISGLPRGIYLVRIAGKTYKIAL